MRKPYGPLIAPDYTRCKLNSSPSHGPAGYFAEQFFIFDSALLHSLVVLNTSDENLSTETSLREDPEAEVYQRNPASGIPEIHQGQDQPSGGAALHSALAK